MILQKPDPVLTAHLFAPMRVELLRVLASLHDADWRAPTACNGWRVKDVALHLLGNDIGLLSRRRDDFSHTDTDFESFEQLVAFVNLQNDIWMRAARRISPVLLLHLLDVTGDEVAAWVNALDMSGTGAPVDWAGGSQPAPLWLDVAREYTEYWVHHQHICDAMDIDSLKEREFFAPVVGTFMRALPRSYARLQAPTETLVRLDISGAGGAAWSLLRERGGWRLYAHANVDPAVTIRTDDETVWRLFTKGIGRKEAERGADIDGDAALAAPFFETVAILA